MLYRVKMSCDDETSDHKKHSSCHEENHCIDDCLPRNLKIKCSLYYQTQVYLGFEFELQTRYSILKVSHIVTTRGILGVILAPWLLMSKPISNTNLLVSIFGTSLLPNLPLAWDQMYVVAPAQAAWQTALARNPPAAHPLSQQLRGCHFICAQWQKLEKIWF